MRLFIVAAFVAAFMALGASAAFAGEITGSGKGGPNGDGTPGGTLNAQLGVRVLRVGGWSRYARHRAELRTSFG